MATFVYTVKSITAHKWEAEIVDTRNNDVIDTIVAKNRREAESKGIKLCAILEKGLN